MGSVQRSLEAGRRIKCTHIYLQDGGLGDPLYERQLLSGRAYAGLKFEKGQHIQEVGMLGEQRSQRQYAFDPQQKI